MGKGNRYGAGTFIETEMFLSEAFLSLGERGTAPAVSNCSAQVLIMLLGKRTFAHVKQHGKRVWARTDDNRISLTYAELKARGISQQRATRSFDELLAKGFIEIVNPGGLFERDKALYALTIEFRFWRRGTPPIRTRQRDMKRGYQGKKLGAISDTQKQESHTSTGDTHAHVNEGHPLRNTHTPAWDTYDAQI